MLGEALRAPPACGKDRIHLFERDINLLFCPNICRHGRFEKEDHVARKLPATPSLRYLRKEAKDLLKAHSQGDSRSVGLLRNLNRFRNDMDSSILASRVYLHEAQLALALDCGFRSWPRLVAHVRRLNEKNHLVSTMMRAAYDQVAEEYAALQAESGWPRTRWVRRVMDLLPDGSAFLDLGCGSGDPADIETSRNHEVTGVDISETQIGLARRSVPEGRFLRGDMASVEFQHSSFDAVICCYAVEHIPREHHDALFRRIASAGRLLRG